MIFNCQNCEKINAYVFGDSDFMDANPVPPDSEWCKCALLGCAHGRLSWNACPHCLGLSVAEPEKETS